MGIRCIPEITPERQNVRLEPMFSGNTRFMMVKQDPVEPVPVGSYVAMVFRVTGYSPDCDGSLLATVEHVDRDGSPTGWTENALGLYPETDVLLDGPGDLHALIAPSSPEGEKP